MTEMQLPLCAVVGAISNNQTSFDFSNAALNVLKSKLVDPNVIVAMLQSQLRNGIPSPIAQPCSASQTAHFAGAPNTTLPANNGQPIWPTLPQDPNNGNIPAVQAQVVQGVQSNTGVQEIQGNDGQQPQAPPLPPAQLSADALNALATAKSASLNFTISHADHPDPNPCHTTDHFCITVDWSKKNSDKSNVLTRSGDYRFHAISLNTVLYAYTLQGQTNQVSAANDLALLKDAATTVQQFVGQATQNAQVTDQTSKTSAAHFGAPPPPSCSLINPMATANSRLKSLQTALDNIVPKRTDKGFPSVKLSDTIVQWTDVLNAFRDFGNSVQSLQEAMNNTTNCSSDDIVAAAAIINEKATDLRDKVNIVDLHVHEDHAADRIQHCERTAGCSISITESLASENTVIPQGNPFVLDYKPFYAQLSVSGGFLLTRLPALSYSSRTAPDPADPTNKTQNVLSVDGNSSLRPALVALLTYHLPISWLDGINHGIGVASGPVIEVANGKADTSKFGVFGGVSVHLWNRFFLTPGVHVGELADFPQGFTHAGQVIPPNTGTPTPVKRYGARFGFAITYTVKDLTSGSDSAQQTTKATAATTPSQSNK